MYGSLLSGGSSPARPCGALLGLRLLPTLPRAVHPWRPRTPTAPSAAMVHGVVCDPEAAPALRVLRWLPELTGQAGAWLGCAVPADYHRSERMRAVVHG